MQKSLGLRFFPPHIAIFAFATRPATILSHARVFANWQQIYFIRKLTTSLKLFYHSFFFGIFVVEIVVSSYISALGFLLMTEHQGLAVYNGPFG